MPRYVGTLKAQAESGLSRARLHVLADGSKIVRRYVLKGRRQVAEFELTSLRRYLRKPRNRGGRPRKV